MTEPNSITSRLTTDLVAARQHQDARTNRRHSDHTIHVVGAGATLTAAYEQLRNAAEYAEEHVLLQRAIRRFFRRLFLLRDRAALTSSGEDLIIELTQAGYIGNDTIPVGDAEAISRKALEYFDAYATLEQRNDITHDQADQWTFELLSVEIEWMLNDNEQLQAFSQFCHEHFRKSINFDRLFDSQPESIDVSLYVAVHRALLKSDDAVIRLGLLKRFRQSDLSSQSYTDTCRQIEGILRSQVTETLYRVVDRRGAPFRVLRHMIDDQPAFVELTSNREHFLLMFEKQIAKDYEAVNRRINKGIIKSVVFLIITKFLIGIAIEVPYDYLVFGMILWTPLLINLFFPPAYMLLLRTTMMLPGGANTKRLVDQIDGIMFQQSQSKELDRRTSKEFGASYNVAYGAIFVIVFGSVALLLWKYLAFDLMHLLIFFTFLSAASFLGFRLSRMIREIESIETYQNGVTLVRDFLYMPFVVVGRFISEKYSKVNVIALALDMLIELPLKTILRLVRQWAVFISTKKDEL